MGPQYIGIKSYNNLQSNIKQLFRNNNQLMKALLHFLQLHSFYDIFKEIKFLNNLFYLNIYIYILCEHLRFLYLYCFITTLLLCLIKN
jgi:hypothetical protein